MKHSLRFFAAALLGVLSPPASGTWAGRDSPQVSPVAAAPVLSTLRRDDARVGAVAYPRAVVRRLGFSKEPLSLYEGRAVMRFNLNVPANYQTGLTELRAKVTYQSCNDEVCFPPTTREVKLGINVVGPNESVKRINGQYFGR